MWPLIAGAIAAPMLGGIIGNASASGDAEEAKKMRQQAIDQWKNINLPSIESQRLSLSPYQSMGNLRPELENTIQQGQTNFNQIQTDPYLKQAQYQALNRLQNLANQGGMTPEDKDKQVQAQLESARQEKSQRQALMQNMAARGMAGSGTEIASQLQAQQSGANRNAEQNLGIQAMAQRRALQAMMGSGEMASQMRGQQFGEQAEAARAQDLINNFNARNAQGVMGANIDRVNQSQAYNLGNAQHLANRNTDLSNYEQSHNKGLYQQNFDNQTRIAAGIGGQYNNMADANMLEAQRKRAMWAGMGQGVGQGLLTYGLFGGGNKWMPK